MLENHVLFSSRENVSFYNSICRKLSNAAGKCGEKHCLWSIFPSVHRHCYSHVGPALQQCYLSAIQLLLAHSCYLLLSTTVCLYSIDRASIRCQTHIHSSLNANPFTVDRTFIRCQSRVHTLSIARPFAVDQASICCQSNVHLQSIGVDGASIRYISRVRLPSITSPPSTKAVLLPIKSAKNISCAMLIGNGGKELY